jgi:hypothetical protein
VLKRRAVSLKAKGSVTSSAIAEEENQTAKVPSAGDRKVTNDRWRFNADYRHRPPLRGLIGVRDTRFGAAPTRSVEKLRFAALGIVPTSSWLIRFSSPPWFTWQSNSYLSLHRESRSRLPDTNHPRDDPTPGIFSSLSTTINY